MTRIVAVCLGVLVWCAAAPGAASASENFELAKTHGNPNKLSFFSFRTSALGKYVIRHDGMGEIHIRTGGKRVFYLANFGTKTRIDRIYFLEHEGDLFLFCETHNASSQSAFLTRMGQRETKTRWTTAITSRGAPLVQGKVVIVGSAEVSKTDGRILRED